MKGKELLYFPTAVEYFQPKQQVISYPRIVKLTIVDWIKGTGLLYFPTAGEYFQPKQQVISYPRIIK